MIKESELAPVAQDMSAYILGGRSTNAALGIAEAEDAERLGFRRVWISERYNLKESAVLFGGIAGRTPRLGVGTGAMTIAARSPVVTAAIGATVHSAFGPRCVLGLGRGNVEFNRPHGLKISSYQALIDYADIMKRLWRGEEVNYDGPAGNYQGLMFTDLLEGPKPEIWAVNIGGPRACRASAHPSFDGVMLGFVASPEATRRSIAWIKEECERIGRDFNTLRIAVPVPTAPDFDPETSGHRSLALNPSYGGRMVSRETLRAFICLWMTQPSVARGAAERNGWDMDIVDKIINHPLFQSDDDLTPDYKFRDRTLVADAAQLVPDEWIDGTCAVGSTEHCVSKLQEFIDAGAHEIATYTSSPGQNADVIKAWRERPQAGGKA